MRSEKAERIRQELRSVGATAFGLSKFSSRFLPQILHDDEHIKGAVYGRYISGTGLLRWTEGMLVATDRRVIFLDRKPGFEAMDELTYDVISGVQKMYAWPFSAITLHTKIGNYTIRFANATCIDVFMHYIEVRRLETLNGTQKIEKVTAKALERSALEFLNDHEVSVVSTVDRAGNVYGTTMHYSVIDDSLIYLLTKAETQKVNNITSHDQVAITVFDQVELKSLQIQGIATVESDHIMRDRIFQSMSRPRIYGERMELPPVTHIERGAYLVVKVVPYSVTLSDFSHKENA